jgi:hypothetical protein
MSVSTTPEPSPQPDAATEERMLVVPRLVVLNAAAADTCSVDGTCL